MKQASKRTGNLWASNGSHALEKARKSAPGIGTPIPKSWCFMCGSFKPIAGSTRRRNLFVCGDCKSGSLG